MEVGTEGRARRTCRVVTSGIKSSQVKPPDRRHPKVDECAQCVDSRHTISYTLVDRREATFDSGVMAQEYLGTYQVGSESDWLSERGITGGFKPLQVDAIRALVNP